MNWKTLGDLAQNCVIGELAKYGLGVAFLLSDNFPFDIIVIANDKLFKVQIRGSSSTSKDKSTINFNLTKNNFYSGNKKEYTLNEVDVFALYDFIRNKLHLVKYDGSRKSISIRYELARGKNNKPFCLAKDTEISKEIVKTLFDFDPPDFRLYHSTFKPKQYTKKCIVCENNFSNGRKTIKYCSHACAKLAMRKVKRPTKEQLEVDISTESIVSVGKKYGVSDNAIRKWIKFYEISV